jgi:hypothetical protein
MKKLNNIIRVERPIEITDYLLGVLPNNTVTLISKNDGSIAFPDLLVKSIYWFSENFFEIEDTNSLSFLFDKRNGTKLIPQQILSGSWNEYNITEEEKDKINKFYIEHWSHFNDGYYMYTYHYVTLVKKDSFEIILPEWYKSIDNFNDNIIILKTKNNKYVLYNHVNKIFLNMKPYSYIEPISSALVLIGNSRKKQRLYQISDDNQTINDVFVNKTDFYLTSKDIIELENGQHLITANDTVVVI